MLRGIGGRNDNSVNANRMNDNMNDDKVSDNKVNDNVKDVLIMMTSKDDEKVKAVEGVVGYSLGTIPDVSDGRIDADQVDTVWKM